MSRRAIALAAAGATAVGLLATTAPASAAPPAQGKKPFVVLMTEAPALGYTGGSRALAPTRPAKGQRINPRSAPVKAYVAHVKQSQVNALRAARVTATPRNQTAIAANGFAVSLTETEAARLRSVKGVAAVEPDVLRQKQTDVTPAFLGLTGRGGAWASGLTGKGVVVGVIDTGIWPEHPSFVDNGKLSRPPRVAPDVPCEFGDTAHNPLDKPFTCQNKLLGARDMRITYKLLQGPEVYNSARDYDGHGTHTASTAAGDRNVSASIFGINRGKVSGIAPDAGIIAYSALGELGGYGSDLGAAIDQAVADGVDVINYSVGSTSPTLGLDGLAFLWAADAGVYVANSNGNAGPNPSTTGSPAFLPWLTAVGASTTPRTFESTLTLGPRSRKGAAPDSAKQRHPKPAGVFKGASITEGLKSTALVDAADRGNPLCLGDTPFTPALNGEIVLCLRGQNARVDKSKAVLDGGGAGMVLYNQNDLQALMTDNHWLPAVQISYSDGLKVKQYIQQAGATATASLTAGKSVKAQPSVMADFSSRGPVGAPGVPDIIRPDVTAPGVNILAGDTPTPTSGRPGQLFQSISGTSMSSPHVAGLFALIKQAHPDWSAAIAKSAIMTTARQNVTKEDGKTQATPFDMGAGHVDPGRPAQKNSMFDPGLAYDAGLLDYASFACGNIPIQLWQPSTCAQLEAMGYSPEAAQLNVPSIGVSNVPGVKVVKRTVTNVSAERVLKVRAAVENPPGYRVSVSPSTLAVPRGKTATFEVTIRNTKAPSGEWRFGALTWKSSGYSSYGKRYEVRSPIAVKGTLLGAPSAVSVSGSSGTGSVPVSFGYTGPFSANSYGLAAEVATPGTVSQDPDQTFDPGDVGNGATAHSFDLTGVKLWRVTLKDEDLSRPGTDVDLDLYLYGPDGTEVASSGAGGTDELIELRDPAPGVYTLYVHGWGVGAEPVGYTLRSWAVSAQANSGTLELTDVPSTATLGGTGTVGYSWSGVPAGAKGLGLLEYEGPGGVIGHTIVDVTG